MEQNTGNNKIKIAEIATDVKWIKKEITNLRENHIVSIYKRIGNIEKRTWIHTGILTIFSSVIIYITSR